MEAGLMAQRGRGGARPPQRGRAPKARSRPPKLSEGELRRRRKIQEFETELAVMKMQAQIQRSRLTDLFLVLGLEEE